MLQRGPGRIVVVRRPIVVVRGPRRIFVHNRWRTFVPLARLATIVVGTRTYYPNGFVALAGPVCTGITPEGCQLRWQAVPTEEGGSEYQCVQYCPQRVACVEAQAPCTTCAPTEAQAPCTTCAPTEAQAPCTTCAPTEAQAPCTQPECLGTQAQAAPAETTGVAPTEEQPAAAPPPQAPETGCELLIYSEENFKGSSSPAGESLATLGQEGWKNEIASIEVKSGTWDFYTDDNYGGEMMRLGVGTYPTLDPKWSKHIGSFMCSSPGK